MATYVCFWKGCRSNFKARASARTGRHVFCSRRCYQEWRSSLRPVKFAADERRRDYHRFKRLLWGGSGKGANEVGAWARTFAKRFEKEALNRILPLEGFTKIDNWCNHSNVFFIDFVATKNKERVLVDVTSKWAAHVPEKVKFARSLGLRLFILHISPRNPRSYWLRELRDLERVSKVPMSFFHALHKKLGSLIKRWPDPAYIHKRGKGARKAWSRESS